MSDNNLRAAQNAARRASRLSGASTGRIQASTPNVANTPKEEAPVASDAIVSSRSTKLAVIVTACVGLGLLVLLIAGSLK